MPLTYCPRNFFSSQPRGGTCAFQKIRYASQRQTIGLPVPDDPSRCEYGWTVWVILFFNFFFFDFWNFHFPFSSSIKIWLVRCVSGERCREKRSMSLQGFADVWHDSFDDKFPVWFPDFGVGKSRDKQIFNRRGGRACRRNPNAPAPHWLFCRAWGWQRRASCERLSEIWKVWL